MSSSKKAENRKVQKIGKLLKDDAVKKQVNTMIQLKQIKPLTKKQHAAFTAWDKGDNLVIHGSPGTGKSFIALYLGLKILSDSEQSLDHIKIIRSAVPSREMGFLPGSPEEKSALYELPYKSLVAELYNTPKNENPYSLLVSQGIIDFQTTSFIRGLTYDRCTVIIDEAQNCNQMELHSIVTRLGQKSRLILCGDTSQNDLINKRSENSGLPDMIDIMKMMPSTTVIEMDIDDIVRSGFVRDYIIAKHNYEKKNTNFFTNLNK